MKIVVYVVADAELDRSAVNLYNFGLEPWMLCTVFLDFTRH